MQPNKSVEERSVDELFEDFEGRAVNNWRAKGTTEEFKENRKCMQQIVKEIKVKITNTVLQGVVEMVGKLKQKELEYTKKPSTNTAIRRMMVRRQSRKNTLDEVSSLLNDQIISNEKFVKEYHRNYIRKPKNKTI